MEKKNTGKILGINGPVVTVAGNTNLKMLDMVYVGHEKLIGEVISVKSEYAIVQVYEVTTGLKAGEPVESTGAPLSLLLGPGIIGNVFDGIQRPLSSLKEKSGIFINRGISVNALDMEKKWSVIMKVKVGDNIKGSTVIATVKETDAVVHKIITPENVEGVVESAVDDGLYTNSDIIVTLNNEGNILPLTMVQSWPVRKPRPYRKRHPIGIPLITGQRVIDSCFPLAKGGTAAIPGGFGTGKTLTQHQLAKWCDADIIVYIGCGERGNEITEVLEDFPRLIDPRTNQPLMNRTILIANTSNMPVAAREASIYTGITLAEYYRDMGLHVAVMADSTSRWAEALREISGRLEEMPAEEGFPAYLQSRLSEFYERAGYVETLNSEDGSVSIIGAVSPQGGDFSEPVTQNTKRFVRCFWALDKQLAYMRHYPAINWVDSYSEYIDEMKVWYTENADTDFLVKRQKILQILQDESKLLDIVKLIGSDILPDDQKLILEISRAIRFGFLQQNAYHKDDTYVPIKKQYLMMETILNLFDKSKALVNKNIPVSVLKDTGVFEDVINIKYKIPNDRLEDFKSLNASINKKMEDIEKTYSLKSI
jgi:V/A-type H+-transporting ATPase subunit A